MGGDGGRPRPSTGLRVHRRIEHESRNGGKFRRLLDDIGLTTLPALRLRYGRVSRC